MNIPGLGKVSLDMLPSGKLEKMKIFAYADAKMERQIGSPVEVLINPESYTLDYKLKVSKDQGQGASAAQLKYEYTEPSELSFEFLFDCTGIIDGQPRPDVSKDIADFKKVVLEYKGDNHEPPYIKLAWGTSDGLFKGRLTALSINYKLFGPNGSPLRAVAKATFKQSIDEEERAAREKNNSPDLTHHRVVKAGDTLDLMCKRIYGDPKYYLQVAAFNRLGNFRNIKPGMEILFPPIEKTKKANN